MKNLILVRHAKSSWDDPSLPDRDRPLSTRGKRDAPAMGRLLKARGLQADLMVSSPAKRARKTAIRIAKALGYPKERIDIDERLYLEGVGALVKLISALDDRYQRVMLFGHNPEFTELANRLTGTEIANIPTCGVVSIIFDSDTWRACAEKSGHIGLFERPTKPASSSTG